MTKKYDANSVQKLSFREGVRQRVGMYLGSPDVAGATNGLFEIISNSVDEAIIGAGKRIEIEIWKDAASVRDFGRGIPRGPKGDIKEVLITLLTESHSGAKFNDDSYTSVRGLNGIGSGATNCSSDYFMVISKRDGFEWTLEFEMGIPKTDTAIKGKATNETGTYIYFKPSQSVFSAEPLEFDFEYIAKKVKDMSYLLPGITFVITNGETKEVFEYCSKNIPKWNTISVGAYHIREAGASCVQEIAFAFSNAISYIEAAIKAGQKVDDFAPGISWIFP